MKTLPGGGLRIPLESVPAMYGAVPAPAVFDPEAGTISIEGSNLLLEHGEKYVVKLLVEHRTASLDTLKSAHDRPDRILKRLREKYPVLEKYISLPGGPGRGGYSTSIVAKHSDTSCQK